MFPDPEDRHVPELKRLGLTSADVSVNFRHIIPFSRKLHDFQKR